MAHEIKWHTEDSIILVQLEGDLEISEFSSFDRQIVAHIDKSSRPLVHVWVNLLGVTKFPNSVMQVQQSLTHLKHPKVGWSILITENRMIRFVGYMITQITKARFRAFVNPTEALEFLKTVDSTLEKV